MEKTSELVKDDSKLQIALPVSELLSIPTHNVNRTSITSASLSDVPSDVIIETRIKYGSRLSASKGLLMEYSKRTTIHGIRYIFEVHRPFYEKLCWLVLTCMSAYFAFSTVWGSYLKWKNSPVILGYDDTLLTIHQIPFPTVTICPEVKSQQKTFHFANISRQIWKEFRANKRFENIANITQKDLERLAATLQICNSDVERKFSPILEKIVNPNIAQTLKDLSLKKNESCPICKWNGRYYFCDKIVSIVATDEGICYQFNGLRTKDFYRHESFVSITDPDEVDFNDYIDPVPPLNNITGNWSLETGFVDQGLNSYPQRTLFATEINGFHASLNVYKYNFDYDCRKYKHGYKVFLNSPESLSLITGNYIWVPNGYNVVVSIQPEFIMSTGELREFNPEKRKCFFDDERHLRFFRYYSQRNCQTECLTNFTIAKCGCAKFWMPKPPEVPTCTLADLECFDAAQQELNLIIENQTIAKTFNANVEIMCNCMAACSSLEYHYEVFRYHLEKTIEAFRERYVDPEYVFRMILLLLSSKVHKILGILIFTIIEISRIIVRFKQHQLNAMRRKILFSKTTLIANCGGILGLFMGISGFSIIELAYFLTMRMFSNCRNRWKTKKRLMEQVSK